MQIGINMVKEEIRIRKAIAHILDGTVGLPILSDKELEYGAEFADFLKEHIYKVYAGDDAKDCGFYKEQSEVYKLLSDYREEDFVEISKELAGQLYEIMNANVDIPAADLLIVRFKELEVEYLAILKMNYKEFYTHKTMNMKEGSNANEIIKYKSILPGESSRLQEAAIIRMNDLSIRLIEKKYEIDGKKENYFSYLYLKCSGKMSHKSKLNLVTRAVEAIQNENLGEIEQYEEHMKAKKIIHEELTENGSVTVEKLGERIFEKKPELKEEFKEKMEHYDLVREEIAPKSEVTTKKFQKQCLLTDTGIEINIPMEEYRNQEHVEFITNSNGTVSVLIKNIGHIRAKF